MSRGILRRYHASAGKSVKSLMGTGAKRLAVFLHLQNDGIGPKWTFRGHELMCAFDPERAWWNCLFDHLPGSRVGQCFRLC
jgi:hypothetical protein